MKNSSVAHDVSAATKQAQIAAKVSDGDGGGGGGGGGALVELTVPCGSPVFAKVFVVAILVSTRVSANTKAEKISLDFFM